MEAIIIIALAVVLSALVIGSRIKADKICQEKEKFQQG